MGKTLHRSKGNLWWSYYWRKRYSLQRQSFTAKSPSMLVVGCVRYRWEVGLQGPLPHPGWSADGPILWWCCAEKLLMWWVPKCKGRVMLHHFRAHRSSSYSYLPSAFTFMTFPEPHWRPSTPRSLLLSPSAKCGFYITNTCYSFSSGGWRQH